MPPSGSTTTTMRSTAGMPKGPDRDSIQDTWSYLASGITKIMTDLQNGMTMDDVSISHLFLYCPNCLVGC